MTEKLIVTYNVKPQALTDSYTTFHFDLRFLFTENERIRVSGDSLAVQNVQKPRDTFSIQCHVTKDTRAHVSDATLTVIGKCELNNKRHLDTPVKIW